jgi:hypothetical protein
MQFKKLNLVKMSQKAENILKSIYDANLSNKELVQIIELCGDMLNLKTRSDYAKENKLSYNGAKKCRENITIFGTKYIMDND